jgi:hypothetical protein
VLDVSLQNYKIDFTILQDSTKIERYQKNTKHIRNLNGFSELSIISYPHNSEISMEEEEG